MKGNAKLYKPGDEVFVSDDIMYMNTSDGVGIAEDMRRMAGKRLTIKEISYGYPKCGSCYTVNENTFLWQDEMFDTVRVDENAIDNLLS